MKAIGYSTWSGTWRQGSGTISTNTDTVKDAAFTFSSRFEGTPGASPEELLAAAIAGCFNQALANNLDRSSGCTVKGINTSVTIVLESNPGSFPSIDDISVVCDAEIPGFNDEEFQGCTERARTHCVIARLMKREFSLQARLSR